MNDMNDFGGVYKYRSTFYTGSENQPDNIHAFVKPKKDFDSAKGYTLVPSANLSGYVPLLSCVTGAFRVKEAVKVVFQQMQENRFMASQAERNDCWMAFRNAIRGIVEMLPIAGNLSLIIWDALRSELIVNGPLRKELSRLEGVAGVSIEGKVVFTIPLEALYKKHAQEPQPDDGTAVRDTKRVEELAGKFTGHLREFLKGSDERNAHKTLQDAIVSFKSFYEV